MTGRDIYITVSGLLGYDPTPVFNGIGDIMAKNTLNAINRVLEDISDGDKLIRLNDEIKVDEKVLHALPYGVAMFLALIDGDSVRYNAFCDIYNDKRRLCKSNITRVQNVVPYTQGGGRHEVS